MKNYKNIAKVCFITIVGLLILAFAQNINAQRLTSSVWTGWMRMPQNGCIQRAKVSLRMAKIPITDSKNWYVAGNSNRLQVRIKCIADDNSNNLVNSRVNRNLLDIEVTGFASDIQRLNRLRNCISQFVRTGRSSCWNVGNTPNIRRISWTATPRNLRLAGNNGQRYTLYCPPNGQIRPIWGSISYTDTSSICTAAAHNGSIIRNRGGNVVIEMDSGPRYFTSTLKNGIRSRQYPGEMRAFNFITGGTGNTNTNVLGMVWNETESGWKGVWTRRGNSNVFDAVWTLGNNVVKGTLTIRLNGNRVTIVRRNSSDSISCDYKGTLSRNKRNVRGTYTCWRNRTRLFTNRAWNATINRNINIPPPGVRRISWADTPRTLRLTGNNRTYTFYCVAHGSSDMPIWGSVSYTDNSSICTAAVHNGTINRNRGGIVNIQLDSGPRFFRSITRNGVRSREYRGQIRAFSFVNGRG